VTVACLAVYAELGLADMYNHADAGRSGCIFAGLVRARSGTSAGDTGRMAVDLLG
jgi:hypothetical protein